jgi:hypothetical protein
MIGTSGSANVGSVSVMITNGGTKSPDQWAKEIADKVLYIADTAHPMIRDQAMMFKDQMFRVIRDNIALAIEQEREWLHNQIRS